MNYLLQILTCILLLANPPAVASVQDVTQPVSLSEDERECLSKHPHIELGYTDAFEPSVIVNADGRYRGTSVNLLVSSRYISIMQ